MSSNMNLLKDSKAASFFFSNRFKKMNEFISQYTSLDINQSNLNMFVTAKRIACEKFGYTMKALDMYHQPWQETPEEKNEIKFIEIQGFKYTVAHVISVHNGYI